MSKKARGAHAPTSTPTSEEGWLHLLSQKTADAWQAGYEKGLSRSGIVRIGHVGWAANIEGSILEVRFDVGASLQAGVALYAEVRKVG